VTRLRPKFSLSTALLVLVVANAVVLLESHWAPWVVKATMEQNPQIGFAAAYLSASFSPEGERIVLAGAESEVVDSSSLKVLVHLSGHTDRVAFACFSPDARRIVTASDDKTARVWDSI